jgi:hypothetical protein
MKFRTKNKEKGFDLSALQNGSSRDEAATAADRYIEC